MNSLALPSHFRDANYQEVPYDGSEVHWRVSIYGICIVDGRLLTVKHKDEKYFDIPGGGVELGETLPEALARESSEEAGWHLQPIKPVAVASEWFYHIGEKKFYRSLQLFWLAEGKQILDKPTEKKIESVQFVELAEIEKLPLYPNALSAVKELQK